MGDNGTIPAYGMGTIRINTSQCTLVVRKVLFAPKIGVNLASISRIMQDGSTTVTFHANHCDIVRDGSILAVEDKDRNISLYALRDINDSVGDPEIGSS